MPLTDFSGNLIWQEPFETQNDSTTLLNQIFLHLNHKNLYLPRLWLTNIGVPESVPVPPVWSVFLALKTLHIHSLSVLTVLQKLPEGHYWSTWGKSNLQHLKGCQGYWLLKIILDIFIESIVVDTTRNTWYLQILPSRLMLIFLVFSFQSFIIRSVL